MFIQVIQGKTTDEAGLRRQFDRWEQDVRPGVKGYLGSTGGVAKDGTVIMLARFEDEATARANSDRAEQGAWWNETSKFFDGGVTFMDSTDVDSRNGGGSDAAGFVQIMQGKVADRKRLAELEDQFLAEMSNRRPDLLGMLRAWDGDKYTQAVYFTSEADAREQETASAEGEPPPEFQEFLSLMQVDTYIDLSNPWLRSA